MHSRDARNPVGGFKFSRSTPSRRRRNASLLGTYDFTIYSGQIRASASVLATDPCRGLSLSRQAVSGEKPGCCSTASGQVTQVAFFRMKKSGDTPLMLPPPTARHVPTETGFKLREGSELTTIERLPVCNLGDHFCSDWDKRQSASAAADSVRGKSRVTGQ
jgi:hypothetical protein